MFFLGLRVHDVSISVSWPLRKMMTQRWDRPKILLCPMSLKLLAKHVVYKEIKLGLLN